MSNNYDEETGEVYDIDEFLTFANTPLKDDKGYVKGKLVKIDRVLINSSQKRTTRFLSDDVTQKAFKFIFEIVGSKENIKMTILTGTNVSPDIKHIKAQGRGKNKEQPEYNKLTELLLRLNVFNIDELKRRDELVLNKTADFIKNIEKNNIYIKSKLEMQNNDTSFTSLYIKSIEVIPAF